MAAEHKHKSESAAIDRIRRKAMLMPVQDFVHGLSTGDRNVLAQAITLVESSVKSHQKHAAELLRAVLPQTGKSIRIGITGVPGVGKSTFIESFGTYLTGLGKRVAVLAIDPSSPITGGAILGDKTRMEQLSVNPNAFIRPSASASSLGGVARKTRESMLLCEAAGYDVILVETVGVGQSETAVHQMTDFFLLLMLAGAGDQLQGIKRGIMEMCDGMLITKADGENQAAAKRARGEYMSALHFFPPHESGWIPQVETCSSLESKGITDAWEMIEKYERWMKERGHFNQRRVNQEMAWFEDTVRERILDHYYSDPTIVEKVRMMRESVREGKTTAFLAADGLFE